MILALAPESLLTVSAKTKQCVHTAVLASPLRHLSSLRGVGIWLSSLKALKSLLESEQLYNL